MHFPVSPLAGCRAVLDTLASSTFPGRVKDPTYVAARVVSNNRSFDFIAGRGFSRAGFSWQSDTRF